MEKAPVNHLPFSRFTHICIKNEDENQGQNWVDLDFHAILTSQYIRLHGNRLCSGTDADAKKSSTDQIWSVHQLDSIEIGQQIQVHLNSGDILKGIYRGVEQFVYDPWVNLILLVRTADSPKIKSTDINEIRVYAGKKTEKCILALVGAAADVAFLLIIWPSLFVFDLNF